MPVSRSNLELTWIGKEDRPRLESRNLVEEPDRSHHAAYRVTANDPFDNRLISGDNGLAPTKLMREFSKTYPRPARAGREICDEILHR